MLSVICGSLPVAVMLQANSQLIGAEHVNKSSKQSLQHSCDTALPLLLLLLLAFVVQACHPSPTHILKSL
jgi:hypothetical protein